MLDKILNKRAIQTISLVAVPIILFVPLGVSHTTAMIGVSLIALINAGLIWFMPG